jgi:hypothetical protein
MSERRSVSLQAPEIRDVPQRLEDKKTVLKPAFAKWLEWRHGEGFRTVDFALPFKMLNAVFRW